jgi:hypothetical protein
MLFKNSVRTSKRTPHFTVTKINWLTLFKFKVKRTHVVFQISTAGRAVAQAVGRGPVTTEVRVHARMSMWDLWWTKWHWERFFFEFFGFPLSVSFHRGSMLTYHLGDEQQARWWSQFRDTVSPHRHEQQQQSQALELFTQVETLQRYTHYIINGDVATLT